MRMPLLFLLAALSAGAGPVSERARQLHRDALVFDAHVHVINRQFHDGTNLGERLKNGQWDLPRAREGGVDALFFTLYIPEEYYPQRFETKHTLRLYDLAMRQIEANREVLELARRASDIERIVRGGKMAALLDLEGGFDLDGDLGVLRTLYRLGFRSLMLPAHNWANNLADSCCAPAKFQGLSEQGRAVIREMNRLGMVINLSHASDATIEQALEVSTDPLVATHHGLRIFNDIPRNMPEALLRKLAAKGGVVGFHIGNEFHHRPMFDWRTKHAGKVFWDTSKIREQAASRSILDIDRQVAPQFPMEGMPAPPEVLFRPEDWVAVVDRAIQIVGEDHVALGSDFDGGPTLPKGMRDVRDLAQISDAMLRRGYSEERIRKFLGGNLLRLVRQVTEKP
jgi:membrane dipeptidase